MTLLWVVPPPWLALAAMTDLDEKRDAIRRGYWMRRARMGAGVTLEDAAMTVGLSKKSGSTISLWEAGKREIKVQQMKRLARRYGVPASLFMNPAKTDDERLAEAVAEAARLALEDSDEELAPARLADDERGASRRTRPA